MLTLTVAVLSFVGFVVAYYTYGRWLAHTVFRINPNAVVPSVELQDNVDFVPTNRHVLFGHHFTSIAGTGPIVGPAIAVFWGWLPALLWVIVGSIFVGAVHDFGALVVSIRNRGQTVGEVSGRLISPRARVLFLLILFMALTVVLAIFGLVIATIFREYPESVLATWISLPLAVVIGVLVHRRGNPLLFPSLAALLVIYGCIWVGSTALPIDLSDLFGVPVTGRYYNLTTVWTGILFVYCFVASVLPVWIMLQPRDYINSHQLVVALVLLLGGLVVAGATGKADLANVAPAVAPQESIPADAPPIWPFLFITIACGACSGFHCLVSSGTTSKQLRTEGDAQYVAYGSMLLEGALAVIVILACCAGVGMGVFQRTPDASAAGGFTYTAATVGDLEAEKLSRSVARFSAAGMSKDAALEAAVAAAGTMPPSEAAQPARGQYAWAHRYAAVDGWASFRLPQTVGAFVEGGANFLTALGIPIRLGIATIAVLVACFAATTLDSATRLQRYVLQEIGGTLGISPLTNKYVATAAAVALAAWLALLPASPGAASTTPLGSGGTGGLLLWPMFGATNQLLAGLAFVVTVFYLWRRNRPVWFALVPMVAMLVMPVWALLWQMFNETSGWYHVGNWLLFWTAAVILALQVWMVIEALLLFPRIHGVLEETLPPLTRRPAANPANDA